MTNSLWTLQRKGAEIELNGEACAGLEVSSMLVPFASLPEAGPLISRQGEKLPLGQWLHTAFADAAAGGGVHLECLNLEDHIWLAAWITPATIEIETFARRPSLRNFRHSMNNVLNNMHVNAELANLYGEQTGHADLVQALQRVRGETSRGADLVTQACAVSSPLFKAAEIFADCLDTESANLVASSALALPSDIALFLSNWMRQATTPNPGQRFLHLEQPDAESLQLTLPWAIVAFPSVAEYARQQWSMRDKYPACIVHAPSEVRAFQVLESAEGNEGLRLVCWLDI